MTDGYHLVDCNRVLLEEIGDRQFKQKDVASTYALAMLAHHAGQFEVDWPKVNTAIIERWSRSGLERIKLMAHKRLGWA